MSERVGGRRWPWLYAVVVVLVAGYVTAGYGAGWAWTGLSRKVTLWDWMEGLALPVTVALVPLLLRHRAGFRPLHRRLAMALLGGLAALVLLGYLVPWGWTGFTGNTLWDWLTLALLPVVIATSAWWRPPPHWTKLHVGALVTAAVVVAVVVLAGYLVPWRWTGFTGNTAWDWIKLLLLPVLLPTVVLPRLLDAADAWMAQTSAPVDRPPGTTPAQRSSA